MLKKKILVLFFAMFATLTASSESLLEDVSEANREKVQSVIVLINHINWVVNHVKNTNDVRMLELEHEGISLDELNLSSIKDEKIIHQITSIDKFITDRMISIGERKMLARELQYNLDNAIYNAFPSPGAIVAADPWAIAINIAQSTISSYMSYKRAVANLKIKNERDNWELEAEDMRALNRMNEVLLRSQWELVRAYGLDDYWRVSQDQVRILLERINSKSSEKNPDELFRYLNHEIQRKSYQKLPAFWYYLGVYAEKQKEDAIALEAYTRYQKEFWQVLRFDRMAASVAMNKLLLLMKGKYNKEEIKEQLQIIEKNAPTDWSFQYFCAGVYLDALNDKDNCERLLNQAINTLRYQFSESLESSRELCKKGELAISDHTLPDATSLMACEILLLRTYNQDKDRDKLLELIRKFSTEATKNCFAMLSFSETLPFDDVVEYLRPDLRGAFLDYQYDSTIIKNNAPYRFVLYLPLSWYYAGHFDIEAKIFFADGTRPIPLPLHPRYKGANPTMREDELVRYVLDCPDTIVRGLSPAYIEIKLAHKFYPITLVFDISKLKDAAVRDLNHERMYSQKALFKEHDIPLR
mgnify:CR=1 FL=1